MDEKRKFCSRCKTEKYFSEFTNDKNREDGKNFYCRACQSVISRGVYQRNRENINRKQAEYHRRNKEANNARARDYYKNNREKMRGDAKAWAEKNQDAIRVIRKKSKLRHKYGISLQDFNDLLQQQSGNCNLCGGLMNPPYVDHCHHSGRVRSLLCGNCNWGLGQFRDSPMLCRRAAGYLEFHGNVKATEPVILPFVGTSGL